MHLNGISILEYPFKAYLSTGGTASRTSVPLCEMSWRRGQPSSEKGTTLGPSWPECFLGYFHMQQPRGIALGSHRQVSFHFQNINHFHSTWGMEIPTRVKVKGSPWVSHSLLSFSFVTTSANPLPALLLILIASASIQMKPKALAYLGVGGGGG